MAGKSAQADRSVAIVNYAPKARKGEALAPRGSIVVYLAAAGSPRLAALHKAAREGAGVSAKALDGVDKIQKDVVARVTLLHAGDVLATKLPVPKDGTPVRVILPYSGGQLAAGGITLRGDSKDGTTVDAVAVRYAPALSRVEQAAVDLVPAANLRLHLGVALGGGIAGTNDEERRRQEEERRRQEQEEARREQQAARAEAQAEAAQERAERRAEKGAWWSAVGVHLLDETISALTPNQSATALVNIQRNNLAGQ